MYFCFFIFLKSLTLYQHSPIQMSTITRPKNIVIFTYFLMLLKLSSVNYSPIALQSYVYFTTRLSFFEHYLAQITHHSMKISSIQRPPNYTTNLWLPVIQTLPQKQVRTVNIRPTSNTQIRNKIIISISRFIELRALSLSHYSKLNKIIFYIITRTSKHQYAY